MNGAVGADVAAVLFCLALIVGSAWLGTRGWLARAVSVCAVVVGAALLVAGVMALLPGDPIEGILGEEAAPADKQALGQALGLLDEAGNPLGALATTGRFLRGAVTMGVVVVAPGAWALATLPPEPRSHRSQRPVREIIIERLPRTIGLALAAVALALLVAVPLGTLAAAKRGGPEAAFVQGLTLVFGSVPRFAVAPVLILAFAIGWRALPAGGADDGWRSWVLPTVTLALPLTAFLTRLVRMGVLEALSADFVRTARAKGRSTFWVVVRHALPNALLPLVHAVGLQVGALFGGAVVVEKVYSWPGLGLLLVESIRRVDVPVVQGIVLFAAASVALSGLLADVVAGILDPRTRRRDGAAP